MKTKHFLLGLLAIVLTFAHITDASAQLRYGLKADVGLNKTSLDKANLDVENLTSFSVGPAIEFMLPLAVIDVGVDAALLYNDNRMKVGELINGSFSKDEVSRRYLQLPVNAKIKYPIAVLPLTIYAAAGPYASYLINGDKINLQSIKENIEAKKFEVGANIGVGVEVLKMVQVGITYSMKLTDNYSLDKPEWKEALNNKSGKWLVSASLFF